jgi:hypothetical protein
LAVFSLVCITIAAVGDGLRRARARKKELAEESQMLAQRLRSYFDAPIVAIAISPPDEGVAGGEPGLLPP